MSGTVGKQLIRFSELRKTKNPAASRLSFVIGIVVNTAVGPIVDMGAYSFAAQSLIAPFGGLDVVWNALLAPCVLNETLTPRRLLGCLLIIVGTAMAGCFGNHEDSEYTLDSLEETLVNVRVLVYFVVFFAWFLLNRQFFMRYPVGSAIRGVSLGCTAGTIAGNMFCVKAAIELIQRSISAQEGEIWLHWLPYVLLFGAVFFALTNVIYMTQGLREYEALFMVTIYEGSMIVSGCVSGAVVLLDLDGVESWRVLLYGLSILIIVAGMYVIFSQEVMSRSSYLAGKASIQVPEQQPHLLRTTLQRRSLHAAAFLPELLERPVGLTRSSSDPFPVSPKSCNISEHYYPTLALDPAVKLTLTGEKPTHLRSDGWSPASGWKPSGGASPGGNSDGLGGIPRCQSDTVLVVARRRQPCAPDISPRPAREQGVRVDVGEGPCPGKSQQRGAEHEPLSL
uniref:Uncharacterized protein n=1 Tax=Alexandrium catenella TaxID=2925 RepID=A0A7S1KYY3_ALECA|eukprot:CAMPEP_0171176740 /NCGR_PEP_ID=MMETSP0790-20130122/11888_1 /TAXON_ID=2925 /ORGANISM="Alexandrium catenella, Strain OF101" /LENGTH=451 /DNA_ID=CAMNT_0011641633 /DNA_START=131 /DNA_END=1486 /DNA_ORIENTATION=-